MYKIAFVILHYITHKDTIECIDSLNECVSNELKKYIDIIVVNNGSPDNSGDIIKNYVCNFDNVHYIDSKENLGFAKGNNLGYMYAKYELKSDFIVLSNNDIIFKKGEFDVKNIVYLYESYKYHMLGPDIISTQDYQHQNPFINTVYNEKSIQRVIRNTTLYLAFNYVGVDDTIYKFKKWLFNNKNTNNRNDRYIQEKTNHNDNIKLHGSFIIFSPLYVKKYDGLYDKTFMYMEEDILGYICKRDNLKVIYSPKIIVYHKEDSATDAMLINNKYKRRFKYKNVIKSSKEFLKLVRSDMNKIK